MRAVFLITTLAVVGCGSAPAGSDAGTGDTGTGTDGGSGTDAGAAVPILSDGAYTATTNAIVDDTCGGLAVAAMLAAADAEVRFSTPTRFAVDYPCCAVGYTCEVDARGSVSCGGYLQDLVPRAQTTLHFDVTVVDFVATSRTSFDQTEQLTVGCMGDNCAAFAMENGTTFPCSMRIEESFAQ